MIFRWLLAIGVVVGNFTGQEAKQPTYYKSQSGDSSIVVQNFASSKVIGSKEKHLTAEGNLVEMASPDRGLKTSSRQLDAEWTEIDSKTTELRSGRFEREATIIFNSQTAYDESVRIAALHNQPHPKSPDESSIFQAKSDLITYGGDLKKGTVGFPEPVSFKRTSKGTTYKVQDGEKIPVTFDQVIDATGTRGEIVLGVGKDGQIDKPQTGFLDGPVHIKIVRHEMPKGTNVTTTSTYTCVADHLEIDLLSNPGTITAEGNVTVDADSEGTVSKFVVDKFVINVNDQLEPLGFEFYGKPGVTKAQSKDGLR